MKLPVWRRVGAVVIAFLVCAQPVLTSAQSAVSFQYRQPIRGLIVEGSTQPETETAQLYSSCLELKRAKPSTPSGYYVIYPLGTPAGQTVYCDMDTYVEVGQSVTSLGYPSSDGQRTYYPRLQAKGDDWVELREAQGRRTLRLQLF